MKAAEVIKLKKKLGEIRGLCKEIEDALIAEANLRAGRTEYKVKKQAEAVAAERKAAKYKVEMSKAFADLNLATYVSLYLRSLGRNFYKDKRKDVIRWKCEHLTPGEFHALLGRLASVLPFKALAIKDAVQQIPNYSKLSGTKVSVITMARLSCAV